MEVEVCTYVNMGEGKGEGGTGSMDMVSICVGAAVNVRAYVDVVEGGVRVRTVVKQRRRWVGR